MPLTSTAAVRGLLGGSRTWTVVWAVLFGAKILRRITRDKPDVVFRQKLEPGGALLIRNGDRKATIISPEGVEVDG